MSRPVLLFDAHSLGYAMTAATQLSVNGEPVQAVFGILKKVRELLDRPEYRTAVPLFCWDGYPEWRYHLFPEYKQRDPANQKMVELKESFTQQKEAIKASLSLLGVAHALDPRAEADDLAYLLSRKLSASGRHVTLVTGDRDWLQLVTDRVSWLEHRTNTLVTSVNFTEHTGYANSAMFIRGKALEGDSSDNLYGVYKIGPKTAAELLATYGSVSDFLDHYQALVRSGDLKKAKLKKSWVEFAENLPCPVTQLPRQEIYQRNLKMMDLGQAPAARPVIERPGLDIGGFRAFCEERHFNTILNRFVRFIQPFAELRGNA